METQNDKEMERKKVTQRSGEKDGETKRYCQMSKRDNFSYTSNKVVAIKWSVKMFL